MKNIAVLINGSSKYLDLTYNLFEHWNKLYDDINFDFYLSTWEDSIDYSNFKWITKYERLKEDECPYNLKEHPPRRHQPHYSYTLYRVNQLKNSTGKDYDSIIQTRSDYLFSRELLDCLVSLTKGNKVIPNIIFSGHGSDVHNGNLWTGDYFFFGHPKAFDKFSEMFVDIFTKGIFTPDKILMHTMQAEYLNYRRIYNCGVFQDGCHFQGLLIREPMRFDPVGAHTDSGWPTKHPSPYQFKKILRDKGVDWLLSLNNYKKFIDIFETTKKE